MPDRVEEDPVARVVLAWRSARAEGNHGRLGGVDVIDPDVEV